MFSEAKAQRDAAVKASLIEAEEMTESGRPHTEGDFLKKRVLKVSDVLCPDKRQAFSNVSLSRNTVADRVDELAIDLQEQLTEKGK